MSVIVNGNSAPEQLISAIENFGPRYEAPRFWSDIADNYRYSTFHRRHCIFQLFYRHIQPGMKLSMVSDVLRTLLWIKKDNIVVVGDIAGDIPVRLAFDNTVFRFDVLPNLAEYDNHWQVFISISGAVTHEEFCHLLFGNDVDEGNYFGRVLEVGFSPKVVDSFNHDQAINK